MTVDIREHAEALLGLEIAEYATLSGGSLSQVYRLTLLNGESVIAKGGPDPATEANMLNALRDAGAPAPRLLAFDERWLIIEELPSDGRLSDAWPDVGRCVAELHATRGSSYGWRSDYAFDHVKIPNTYCVNWPDFWATSRLLPHVDHIQSSVAQRVETVAAKIHELLPAAPACALLHGDLWGGNLLVSNSRVSGLIDPACYFGHCEVDLAMLSLFDDPGDGFYREYGPLEQGYQDRAAIYSLWPALVHLRLFGDGYLSMTDGFLSSIGV